MLTGVYESVFLVHIIGACATSLVGAYALVALWNSWNEKYHLAALVLGAFATFEILTGTALALISLHVSAASVCERIALYLGLVALIEFLLFKRMKKISRVFPIAPVVSPILGSLGLLFAALVAGF